MLRSVWDVLVNKSTEGQVFDVRIVDAGSCCDDLIPTPRGIPNEV